MKLSRIVLRVVRMNHLITTLVKILSIMPKPLRVGRPPDQTPVRKDTLLSKIAVLGNERTPVPALPLHLRSELTRAFPSLRVRTQGDILPHNHIPISLIARGVTPCFSQSFLKRPMLIISQLHGRVKPPCLIIIRQA